MTAGPLHAFLARSGRDGAGRPLDAVVAFDDAHIEGVHDFIQWCFPLPEASRAVPGAPVLTAAEAEAIRADPAARAGLLAALDRMTRFYAGTDGWLRACDHNHLRISRIIAATHDLVGQEAAAAFHAFVLDRNRDAGSPINRDSLRYWDRALAGA
ncbi:Opioid growth factor receptor (OGFr) conserved region [Methylobacterium sp. Leaf399]|uniref:opioid growth factor receptor-related protein n=1 Tax=Methylobacterium sp. Leaf399 TaxID=1736364 RepID=UPI0006FFF194|nr:opioid growth factor receptor-related protein [Methylobacterium sp. Leaf399]KQT11899.1 Opioid growth factor receptor (OGFr) conserved region [Methylobacterium sp. Leaf399]